MDENNQWYCYICHPEPLLDLVTACNSVFENLEQLLQQNKKKIKVDNEKTSKVYEHAPRFSPKKNSSNCNGEENKLDDSYSGSVTYSYSALIVPKDMIKKAKKLIETTANMNSSYVKFLKHQQIIQKSILLQSYVSLRLLSLCWLISRKLILH